ncbi:MAG TPA: hypothetical protein VFW63_00385 [Acidimicrobiales bacterium]|nr:hypothetical protein [Acidimicrobiales bacterium]
MSDVIDLGADELLASHEVAEPLFAGGVRCHGGFLADGTYASPRTKVRGPALEAWQRQHRQAFGTELLHAPVEAWPANYPNVAQARFLIESGIREPIVATLTRIGTVEGFGSMIRFLAPADMQRYFDEDIAGTATAHLSKGLVEAHARDEAGWGDQAGHDRMWYAVRDIAFEDPVTEDETDLMMQRMGIPVASGADPVAAQRRFLDRRMFEDIDLGLELLVATMLKVLFVEIKAYHVFAWAEELLADRDLVAGEGEAARLVSFIRQDEAPHVEYLRTSLTEMRDRTFIGDSGRRYPGTDVIGRMWDASLEDSLGLLEDQNRAATVAEVERAIAERPRGRDLLARFHELADPVPSPPGP